MEAWVIKRNDGKYFSCEIEVFYDELLLATVYPEESVALEHIKYWELTDCKPIKVRIEEVEE